MKKATVASYSVLVCALAISGASAAEVGGVTPAKSPAALHQQESDSLYAKQDELLLKGEKLAAAGDYAKAIDLFRQVYLELELENDSVDSWRAKSRFRDVGKRLKELQRKFAELKLKKAETAYAGGNYNETISNAAEAGLICEDLRSEADKWKQLAQNKQRTEERRNAFTVDTFNPKVKAGEKEIALNLAKARSLMKAGKYEAARRYVEAVFKLNPFNAEAAYLASKIYEKYYTTGYHRRRADVQGMAAYEAWQWVEPTFLRGNGSNKVPDGKVVVSDKEMQGKLDRIIFPEVNFQRADVKSVLDFLSRESRRNDTQAGINDKRGVIIDFDGSVAPAVPAAKVEKEENIGNGDEFPPAEESAEVEKPAVKPVVTDAKVSLKVNNATLRELLDYISFLTDLSYTVLPDRVVFGASRNVVNDKFDVTPEALRVIAAFSGVAAPAADESGEVGEGEESETASAAKSSGNINLSQDDLKKFFGVYGVDFSNPKSAISYDNTSRTQRIIMTNTPENIQKLREVLLLINTPQPMVRIEVKSVEISDEDWEELGFHWSLGPLGSVNKSGSSAWQAWSGSNTGYVQNSQSGFGTPQVLSMLRSATQGASTINSTLLNNFNIFPNLFGSTKPFGSDTELNLSLTINAIDRSDRTETISAPTVTVSDGQTATVVLGREYYFPESWDTLEVEIEDGGGDSGNSMITVTLPTPTFGDATAIGTTFTVTPKIMKDNKTINLAISPKFTAFKGEDSYYLRLRVFRDGEETPYGDTYKIWRPIIANRSLSLNVNVYDGETLVLGGLTDSRSIARLDKIPILGDLPFIGRLFQSHSENSTRTTMLFFVTARLINDAGAPIHNVEASGGMSEMSR